MKPTRKMPLFIVTGASGAGKSSVCEVLFRNESDYIVLESDILWNQTYDTPGDGYRAYREMWMRVCKNISQIGIPVVLCGSAIPEQFELLDERQSFTSIHYLAVVCDDDTLRERLAARRVSDENWITSSLEFNAWLREHAATTDPPITLLDSTKLTLHEAAAVVDRWVRERMNSRTL